MRSIKIDQSFASGLDCCSELHFVHFSVGLFLSTSESTEVVFCNRQILLACNNASVVTFTVYEFILYLIISSSTFKLAFSAREV